MVPLNVMEVSIRAGFAWTDAPRVSTGLTVDSVETRNSPTRLSLKYLKSPRHHSNVVCTGANKSSTRERLPYAIPIE